jgi:hypothetical protein
MPICGHPALTVLGNYGCSVVALAGGGCSTDPGIVLSSPVTFFPCVASATIAGAFVDLGL